MYDIVYFVEYFFRFISNEKDIIHNARNELEVEAYSDSPTTIYYDL